MAKKNSFLEALEKTDFQKIDMKGVQIGGDYSSVGKEAPNNPTIKSERQFSENNSKVSDLPKKPLIIG